MLKAAEIHTHIHTHGCLCKIIIPIIATFAIINPSYSDIDKNAQSATCDSNTIGTTTGPANLQADWTANTINLKWYNGSNEIEFANDAEQKTCTYDGAITLPATPEEPAGYTFGGWKVKPRPTIFDLRTLASQISTNGTGYAFYANNSYQSSENPPERTPGVYGVGGRRQWAVEFDYGTVKGTSVCWSKMSKSYSEVPQETTGKFCWCEVTNIDLFKDKKYIPVTNPIWVYRTQLSSNALCSSQCAKNCATAVRTSQNVRSSLYGI